MGKKCIILIDIWHNAIEEVNGYLPEYVNNFKNNLRIILNIAEIKDIDIINANYNHGREKEREIHNDFLDYNMIKKKNFQQNKYDTAYICGLSLDGCMLKRELGYRNLRIKNKSIILDASLNEIPTRGVYADNFFNKMGQLWKEEVISNECPKRWIINGRSEWPGPYYYFKKQNQLDSYVSYVMEKQNVNLKSVDDFLRELE